MKENILVSLFVMFILFTIPVSCTQYSYEFDVTRGDRNDNSGETFLSMMFNNVSFNHVNWIKLEAPCCLNIAKGSTNFSIADGGTGNGHVVVVDQGSGAGYILWTFDVNSRVTSNLVTLSYDATMLSTHFNAPAGSYNTQAEFMTQADVHIMTVNKPVAFAGEWTFLDYGLYAPISGTWDGTCGGASWAPPCTTLYWTSDVVLIPDVTPTQTFLPPIFSSLSITKSASPYSLRQFQESTIKVLIENSGTSEVKAIEIMDSIHPSFDLTGGNFPNPKKFDSIRAGESRELQYTIISKESGAFMLDPATVTYADSEGNIQEVKSEPVSIKVVPSSDGGSSGSNTGQYSKSASVSLHGEKTDVVMGEDILLRLSAVNLITKPKMHVQVIIIPPSGMSVTSTEFSKSAAGQFTANYQLEPGDGKDIEVRIRSNQVGEFNVNGRIVYYFGDDKEKAEDQTLNLPIKVRKEIASTQEPVGKSTPGFEGVIGMSGLLFVLVLIKRGLIRIRE